MSSLDKLGRSGARALVRSGSLSLSLSHTQTHTLTHSLSVSLSLRLLCLAPRPRPPRARGLEPSLGLGLARQPEVVRQLVDRSVALLARGAVEELKMKVDVANVGDLSEDGAADGGGHQVGLAQSRLRI
mmetsp:Transcript_11810/g.23001  ORF Transcript_11810/g.23001 Transcript_11810/m.23001 type:complete len:129 (+) Transcript_11810:173-559(+)